MLFLFHFSKVVQRFVFYIENKAYMKKTATRNHIYLNYSFDDIHMEEIMNKAAIFFTTFRKAMNILRKTVGDHILPAAELVMKIFRDNKKPEPCLFLPEAAKIPAESGNGNDFYAVPIKICRKRL